MTGHDDGGDLPVPSSPDLAPEIFLDRHDGPGGQDQLTSGLWFDEQTVLVEEVPADDVG